MRSSIVPVAHIFSVWGLNGGLMKGIHKLLSTYRSLSLLSSQLPVTNYSGSTKIMFLWNTPSSVNRNGNGKDSW